MTTNKTKSQARGYSLWMMRQVDAADPALLGVRLAKFCIAKEIPVRQVAQDLGVSKQAIYAWFVGRFSPNAALTPKVEAWLEKHA